MIKVFHKLINVVLTANPLALVVLGTALAVVAVVVVIVTLA